MIIILLILMTLGIGTIIKHLTSLREQNEVMIEVLDKISDSLKEIENKKT